MAVGFALVDDVHHLLRTGDEALGAALPIKKNINISIRKQEVAGKVDTLALAALSPREEAEKKTLLIFVTHLDVRHPVFVLVHGQVGLGD